MNGFSNSYYLLEKACDQIGTYICQMCTLKAESPKVIAWSLITILIALNLAFVCALLSKLRSYKHQLCIYAKAQSLNHQIQATKIEANASIFVVLDFMLQVLGFIIDTWCL